MCEITRKNRLPPKCARFHEKKTASCSRCSSTVAEFFVAPGGGAGQGGHGLCGIGRSHWPLAGSEMQNVTPGCEGQGCGLVVQPGIGPDCPPLSGGTSTRPTWGRSRTMRVNTAEPEQPTYNCFYGTHLEVVRGLPTTRTGQWTMQIEIGSSVVQISDP
eukprot:COSAG02_NODE_6053_length_3840_cov_2.507618_3_plen_159_part_00